MRPILVPLTFAMLPLVALSAVQMGLPVLAPALVADLGLAPEMVGPIGGCIGLGSIWMFAANNAIMPALGPIRALALAGLLSVMGVIFVVSGWIALILLGAVMIGFAYAVTAPAGSLILSDHVPKNFWGTAFSIRQAGVPLGGAIAGLLGTGVSVIYGWQFGLLCLALLPLICVILPVVAPASFRTGDREIRFRFTELVRPSIFLQPARTVRALPQLHRLTFASLGFAMVQGSVFAFFTTYMTDGLGFSLALAGSLFAVMQVSSFAGRIGAGFLADHIGSLRKTLRGMSVASALACIVMAMMQESWPLPILFAVVVCIGASAATWNGLFLAEIARVVRPDQVGTATAGVTFFTFVSYMLTPPLFGAIVYVAGYQAGYLVGCLAALGSFACLRNGQTDPEPQ